jgi:hypothetical protein
MISVKARYPIVAIALLAVCDANSFAQQPTSGRPALSARVQEKAARPIDSLQTVNAVKNQQIASADLSDTLPPPVPGVTDYVIDGASGTGMRRDPRTKSAPDLTSTEFGAKEFVRVIVRNVNPFLFQYRITIDKGQIVAEASPADFFSAAFPGFLFPKTSTIATNAPLANLKTPALVARNCSVAESLTNKSLSTKESKLVDTRNEIQREFDDQRSRDGKITHAMLKQLDTVVNPKSSALSVRGAAQDAGTALADWSDSLANSIQALGRRTVEYGRAADEYAISASVDPTSCVDLLLRNLYARNLVADAALFQADLQLLQDRKSQVDNLNQVIARTVKDPARFYSMVLLPRFDKPTDVSVVVERASASVPLPSFSSSATSVSVAQRNSPKAGDKAGTVIATITTSIATVSANQKSGDLTEPIGVTASDKSAQPPGSAPSTSPSSAEPHYDKIAAQPFHFGGPSRFSIAAGLIYGALRSPKFGTLQVRVAPTPDRPADTLRNVVALTDSSKFRIVPFISLNTLVKEFKNQYVTGVHLTFGVGVRKDAGNTDLDYLLGAGLSGLGERVMLDIGWYVGKKQYLIGGTALGDQVPTASAPSGSRTQTALGVGLAYRFWPW